MRQSQLFTKTQKSAPADEVSKNAQLLIRAGFIHKEMAGSYMYLPLGLRVVNKIKQIVREEMDAIGGQEFITTTLQRKDLWERTNRWDDEIVDIWFKSQLHAGGEVGLAWSHEEPIADMMKNHVNSFRDLPVYVYQFQTKLRNELRAKSGVMRGREFVMKDMYSFSRNQDEHTHFYNASIEAYKRCFERMGLGDDTYVTFAAGGAFTEFSHEFQTIAEAGEDIIYINREKNIAINDEVMNEKTLTELGVTEADLEKVNSAEVGNIFNFGTQKAEDVGLFFTNEDGQKTPVHMGSYGIGITRLVGVLVEKFSDDNGIIWPQSVAPFQLHLVTFGDNDNVLREAEDVYEQLTQAGIEVLFDDRVDKGPGEKFKDSDLIGIPYRLVVSERSIEQGGCELKKRTESDSEIVGTDILIQKIQELITAEK